MSKTIYIEQVQANGRTLTISAEQLVSCVCVRVLDESKPADRLNNPLNIYGDTGFHVLGEVELSPVAKALPSKIKAAIRRASARLHIEYVRAQFND